MYPVPPELSDLLEEAIPLESDPDPLDLLWKLNPPF
jgi:hypothetical protein